MGHRHDPCLLDCLISAKRFLEGEPAKPWWSYTNERRMLLENSQRRKVNEIWIYDYLRH